MDSEIRSRVPTVVGVGNPLLGDDGLGVRAVELLKERAPAGVRVIDGGLIGLELLHEVEDASHLLIIDSVDAGAAPGSLVRIAGGELPAYGKALSPHELHLTDVMALVRLRGTAPDETIVLGIQPSRVTPGVGLTPQVEASLPRLIEAACEILERWMTGAGGSDSGTD